MGSVGAETSDILDPDIAYLVTDVLQDAIDRGSGAAVRAAVDDAFLEEWPEDIAGRSEPAPPAEYEEAERASRITIEKREVEEEEEEQEEAAKEEAAKAEQQKKAAESVLIP